MADETERNYTNPILDLIARLIAVYLVATFLFSGLSKWHDGQYLLAAVDVSLVAVQIALVFRLFDHKSNIVRTAARASIAVMIVLIVASKLLY